MLDIDRPAACLSFITKKPYTGHGENDEGLGFKGNYVN